MMERYKKLIEKQKELIKFYGERIAANAMFLHIHHIDETLENFNIWKQLIKQISDLEQESGGTIAGDISSKSFQQKEVSEEEMTKIRNKL